MTLVDLSPWARRLEVLDLLTWRGAVARVAGQIVEAKGPPVGIGELCDIHLADGRRVPAEVVGFHEDRRILLPLEGIEGIAPRDAVVCRSLPRTIRLGPGVLGRVLDGTPPPPLSRERIVEPLPLGLRVFDGLVTAGKGQRLGIFAGAGVGKSTLLGEIARTSEADVNVLALVGERGREVREFLEESLGEEGLARSVVVVSTGDTSPIQRVKAAFLAVTVAEYFRDLGRDVLFMMDSVTRLAQAQREIGLAAGEPPTTKGYCPSVFSMLPRLTERMGRARQGSVTGILTILVEGDDMDEPVADAVRSLLDGHVVLTRRLAEQGHYPAVDVLQSVSRLMPMVCSPGHLEAAKRLRAILATYQSAEDLINIGAYAAGSNPRIDKAVELIEPVREFLVQPGHERTEFSQTVRRMTELTRTWEVQRNGEREGATR